MYRIYRVHSMIAAMCSDRARHAYLECIYKSKIVQRDVVVVILHLRKRLFMILHQRVDLFILTLQWKTSDHHNNRTLLQSACIHAQTDHSTAFDTSLADYAI